MGPTFPDFTLDKNHESSVNVTVKFYSSEVCYSNYIYMYIFKKNTGRQLVVNMFDIIGDVIYEAPGKEAPQLNQLMIIKRFRPRS